MARTRETHIGWVLPCRKLSVRDHDSLTGLPIFCEISAASAATSWKRCRPNEPPPSTTCTVTAVCGSPSRSAMSRCATMGTLRLAQISARSERTSAIALSGSRGLLLANAKVNSASIFFVRSGGTTMGSAAALSLARTVSSDSLSTVPGPQVTSSARVASMHWPNVSPRTATPCLTVTTSVMPGMFLTASAFATETTVPLTVGGLRTIVGLASGT